MKRIAIMLILALLAVGCVQVVAVHDRDLKEKVPAVTFQGYFHSGGVNQSGRAVLLIDAAHGIEVVPLSDQVTQVPATFHDALFFMRDKAFGRDILEQRVLFKGKPVGYLFQHKPTLSMAELVTVDLYEKDGKLYFRSDDVLRKD